MTRKKEITTGANALVKSKSVTDAKALIGIVVYFIAVEIGASVAMTVAVKGMKNKNTIAEIVVFLCKFASDQFRFMRFCVNFISGICNQ